MVYGSDFWMNNQNNQRRKTCLSKWTQCCVFKHIDIQTLHTHTYSPYMHIFPEWLHKDNPHQFEAAASLLPTNVTVHCSIRGHRYCTHTHTHTNALKRWKHARSPSGDGDSHARLPSIIYNISERSGRVREIKRKKHIFRSAGGIQSHRVHSLKGKEKSKKGPKKKTPSLYTKRH